MISRVDGRRSTRVALAGTLVAALALALSPAPAPAKKKRPCTKAGCRVSGTYKAVVGHNYAKLALNTFASSNRIALGAGGRTTCSGQQIDVALAFTPLNKRAKIGTTYKLAGSFPDDGNGTATDGTAKITITSAKKVKVTAHINARGVNASESTPFGPCDSLDLSFTAKRV